MARPDQDAIEMFMSITGASEGVALQKLAEHHGDLNEAVNAHFNEGDGHITNPRSAPALEDNFVSIDDPMEVESRQPFLPLLFATRSLNRFSILDPNFGRSSFYGRGGSEFTSRAPFISHPREVREIPIDFKDGNGQSGHSGSRPVIEEVTGSANAHGPEIYGNVIIDDEEDGDVLVPSTGHTTVQNERNNGLWGRSYHDRHHRPNAPGIDNLPDYGNDIEEEMLRAAIEASKREVNEAYPNQSFGAPNSSSIPGFQQTQPNLEDAELARALSLSLKAAEQEKSLCEQGGKVGVTDLDPSDVEELEKLTANKGRRGFNSLRKGSSSQSKLGVGASVQAEAEDVEEQPLVRHRSRRVSTRSLGSAKELGETASSPPFSAGSHDVGSQPQHNGDDAFCSDTWGGISSEEHEEAVMLEAALFGRIPEGAAFRFAYAPHQLMQTGSDGNVGPYPHRVPCPPSPSLEAQRLLREQQDDEYLAALQADQEKELKAMEEAEARRLEEIAAKEAALEEERWKEQESHKKLLEEQEFERQLAAKEASLPQEPSLNDENAITLLVRMPDGSRCGRRFLKSDKLQSLFDFIDVGRAVKPATYRLVRPYPRRSFSDGESSSTLNEVGITSKQEALYLESV